MIIKKLENQFIINYLIVFSIIIILGIFIFLLNTSYEESQDYRYSVDLLSIVEDYDNIPLNKAVKKQGFIKDDYIEVLDINYKIIDSYQSPNKIGYQYSTKEYQKFLSEENSFYYTTYYDELTNKIFVFYLSPIEVNTFYSKGIIIFLILIFIVSIVFARITAKKIILPIKELIKGVNKIEKGIYDNDISFNASHELNLLKDSINRMSKQLKREIELRKFTEKNKENLIANLSHDIKTPLTNIIGYSESILLEDNVNKVIRSDLEVINESGKIANNLTNQLFEFTRINIDNSNQPKKILEINEFLKKKFQTYKPIFNNKNINFNLTKSLMPIFVEINKEQISRAINNLIENAIKYNSSPIKIDCILKKESDFVKIIIKDNGIGINKKWHDTIFNPTTRVDISRQISIDGTGLGLAITKKIINQHNGTIILDSSYENGCKFIIKLPYNKTYSNN